MQIQILIPRPHSLVNEELEHIPASTRVLFCCNMCVSTVYTGASEPTEHTFPIAIHQPTPRGLHKQPNHTPIPSAPLRSIAIKMN